MFPRPLALFVKHRPQLRLQVGQHPVRDQIGPHLEQKTILGVAQFQPYPDAWVRVERFGFPGSEPDPVSSKILFVSS